MKISIPRVILWTYLLIFIDRIITTFYWDFEGNPVVMSVGILGMWFIPLLVIPAIIISFGAVEGSKYQIYADMCAYFLFVLYAVVVASNIAVVIMYS